MIYVPNNLNVFVFIGFYHIINQSREIGLIQVKYIPMSVNDFKIL